MNIYSNSNVRFILIAGLFAAIGNSILWFSPTWLIYGLGGDNADLGSILGTATLTSLTLSLLSSYLADRYRRDLMIWIGVISGIAGALFIASSENLTHVLIGQILMASGFAIYGPAMIALFSNSIPSVYRNRIFGTQFLINTTSSAVGNILIYFLFIDAGTSIETLNLTLIRVSLFVAVFFLIIAGIILLFIRDKYSLTEEEEGTVATSFTMRSVSGKSSINRIENIRNKFAPQALPILLITITSGIFIGFGAGISIPYFPRFFFDIYHLNLSDLSLLFAILTILTAIWGKVNSNLADTYGRVELIVANQLFAVFLLYILALYPPLIFALLTLIVRNAVMNGAWPLSNAIQMEYAPREYRSKISAIATVSWSLMFGIGQIFGGIIVDSIGFWLPFIITASLYLIATILYWRIKSYTDMEDRNRQETELYTTIAD